MSPYEALFDDPAKPEPKDPDVYADGYRPRLPDFTLSGPWLSGGERETALWCEAERRLERRAKRSRA